MKPEIPHPPFLEKMQRFHAQAEQAVYSAWVTCEKNQAKDKCEGCNFKGENRLMCQLPLVRTMLKKTEAEND